MFARGELDAVVSELGEAVHAPGGQTATNYFMLGEAHRLLGVSKQALDNYRQALLLPGDDGVTKGAIYFSRGLCFMSLEEWVAAAEQFESIPNPKPPEALVSAGTCSRFMGDGNRALQLFDDAIKLNGAYSHARVCRAELREAMGERARAAQDYTQILINDAHFTAPYLRQAYIALHEGRASEACMLCDSLLKLLQHAPASAPDYAFFLEQRQQLQELRRQSAKQ